jgi:hypothetical protein
VRYSATGNNAISSAVTTVTMRSNASMLAYSYDAGVS